MLSGLSVNSKMHKLAIAESKPTYSGIEARAQKSLSSEGCDGDSDDASFSDLVDEEADWPATDAEDDEIVKSLQLKKSRHMENMLKALQTGDADPSSIFLLLQSKVAFFAMNKTGCKVLELLVPQLDEAQLAIMSRELQGDVAVLSTHRYGSRTLRAVLAAQLRQPLFRATSQLFVSELLIDFEDIILNPFAGRVLTDLLMFGDEELKCHLGAALLKHECSFFMLCLQEFACHVAAAAIRHCPKRYVFEMAREVLSEKTLAMTRFTEGIVVLRALLEDSDLSQKVKMRLETKPEMLASSRPGRRLMTDFRIGSCTAQTKR